MPGFDFEIGVDELGGHVFGEDVEGENAVVFEVAENLVPP